VPPAWPDRIARHQAIRSGGDDGCGRSRVVNDVPDILKCRFSAVCQADKPTIKMGVPRIVHVT